MTINDQPVENRRQSLGLLTEKSTRRGEGTPPPHGSQSTVCLPADAFRQRQIAAGGVAKAQRHRERK
jgi:hypothetical protein